MSLFSHENKGKGAHTLKVPAAACAVINTDNWGPWLTDSVSVPTSHFNFCRSMRGKILVNTN